MKLSRLKSISINLRYRGILGALFFFSSRLHQALLNIYDEYRPCVSKIQSVFSLQFPPLSSSMGISFQYSGIMSRRVCRTKWLLMNLRMLEMVKVTSGCRMQKYWSRWIPVVCSPGTIFWTVTPACLTLNYMDGAIKHLRSSFVFFSKQILHWFFT